MSFINGISKNIISNRTTQPVGGLEVTAYLWKRGTMSLVFDSTNPNKVTSITKVGTAVIYKYTGVNRNLNAGSDRNKDENLADTWKHFLSLKAFEFDTASVQNIDGLGDLCAIVERKQKSTDGDGIFIGYGFGSGLDVSADTLRWNESNGIRSIEMATKDQEGEALSQYNILNTDYATTKTMLEGLLT